MKRCALAIASFIFCASAFSNNPTPEYTYETVAAYAESWDFAIRWGAGTVKVVDETGILKKNPKILATLNMNLGTTKLVLVDAEKGDITIRWVDELPAPYGQNGCGLSQSKLGMDGVQVIENMIRIKRGNRCMGQNEGEMLLLHELGHALGFAKHAKEDDVMSIHDPAFEHNKVNLETLQRFLKGLYSLNVGQKIPGKEKMPEPLAESFVYQAPIKEEGVVFAYKPPKEDSLPETRLANPTAQYRRVETRDAQGKVSWQFVQTGGGTGGVTEVSSPVATPTVKSVKKVRQRFETIEPAPTEFNYQRRGTPQGTETIGPPINSLGPRG